MVTDPMAIDPSTSSAASRYDQVAEQDESPVEEVIHIHGTEENQHMQLAGNGFTSEEDDFDHGLVRVWDEDSDDDEHDAPRSTNHSVIPTFHLGGRLHSSHRPEFPSIQNWWRTLLIGSAAPGTLSTGHVAINLFSSGLHPGVLLAMPVYFCKSEVVPGMIVLTLVALLGIFGGGLWVALGRYVGGHTIESITSKAFGMNTRWKRNIGHGISSVALVMYCTGAAVIAYHAMTDLLLQVFFHYTAKGQLLHDRAFVTLAIGGALTLPLLLSSTPKRNMFQIQSWAVLLSYPAIIGILLARINDWNLPGLQKTSLSDHFSGDPTLLVPQPHLSDYSWPWASTAMLPLLTLSASPAQILAHNRSLKRKNAYESNVLSFLFAQFIQIALIIGTTYVVGVEIGTLGASKFLGGLHANFFNALPLDDDYVNMARVLFAILLAAHLTVCLASARSCWSRLLNLLNLNPLGAMAPPTPQIVSRRMPQRHRSSSLFLSPAWLPSNWYSPSVTSSEATSPEFVRWKRYKFIRDTLAGLVLWSVTAFTAFFSGVGGFFRLSEKEGEELRFLRSVEYIGILGAIVGYVLPAMNWLVLFKIRKPRAILLLQSKSMRRRISRYLLSPLSALISKSSHPPPSEIEPLLSESGDPLADERGHPTHSTSISLPNHMNEHSANNCDDATLILLARKERELQKKSRDRRRIQELVVVIALLPFGLFLVGAALVELLEGSY